MENPLEETAGNLISKAYDDLAQPSAKKIGAAFGEFFQLILNKVFLFNRVRLANEVDELKYQQYLAQFKQSQATVVNNPLLETTQKNYQKLEEAISSIPDEKITPVIPELSVPILEALTYTTNEDISALFINLLQTAAHEDTAGMAHPAFRSIISSLSADEAKIIKHLAKTREIHYIVLLQKRLGVNPEMITTISPYFAELSGIDLTFQSQEITGAYLFNLVHLGILVDQRNRGLSHLYNYSELVEKHADVYNQQMEYLNRNHPATKGQVNVDFDYGYFTVTDFGRLFIKACMSKLS